MANKLVFFDPVVIINALAPMHPSVTPLLSTQFPPSDSTLMQASNNLGTTLKKRFLPRKPPKRLLHNETRLLENSFPVTLLEELATKHNVTIQHIKKPDAPNLSNTITHLKVREFKGLHIPP
jgi:hypothetical protein